MSRPIPIVGGQRMNSPRQSAKLWSFLAGVVVSTALIGCAGGGEIGPGQSGNGGSNSMGTGGAGDPSGGAGRGGSTTGSGNTGGGSSSTPVYLRASVRRLTNAEYDASVQALLGTTMTPSTNFPPDSRQAVNFTLNDGQRVDPVLAAALDDAAIALVTEARGNNKLANLAPCSNASMGGQACAQ